MLDIAVQNYRKVKGMDFNTLSKHILHAVIEESLAPDDGQVIRDQIVLIAFLQKLHVLRQIIRNSGIL